jgi:hypothetical protein
MGSTQLETAFTALMAAGSMTGIAKAVRIPLGILSLD